jgi:hydroxymethylpyrimidine/phosphomethylpyrimidine kinase
MSLRKTSVLCLSGLDPGGGAGLHADITTLAALGVHCLGLVTALTVQDSRNVSRVEPVDPVLFEQQLACLLVDCQPAAIKLGLLANTALFPVIIATIARLRVPVVLDPVLRAGGGGELTTAGYAAALRAQLLPLATVATPNAAEARRLAPEAATLDAAGAVLVAAGCKNMLVTGGDEPGESVVNTLHRATALPCRYEWPRLPETFHGAGCTLAAAIAGQLALGDSPEAAIEAGQRWTQASLARAYAVGGGRRVPGRLAP